MHFLQAINSDLSVRMVCNKTGGTIKGDIKKNFTSTFLINYKIFVLNVIKFNFCIEEFRTECQ